jgi:hypothetical protein
MNTKITIKYNTNTPKMPDGMTPKYMDGYITGVGTVRQVPVFEKDGKISVGTVRQPYTKDGNTGYSDVVYIQKADEVATRVAELMKAGDKSVYKLETPQGAKVAIATIECEHTLKVRIGMRDDGTFYVIVPQYESKEKTWFYAWPFGDKKLKEAIEEVINAIPDATPYETKETAE